MDTIILIAVLLLLAEVTYLVAVSNKQAARRTNRSAFVDTSVLIDGRIVAIARTGFMTDTLMIPRSVVGELQLLADSADSDKRTRARHGLDVVTELQAIEDLDVQIYQDGSRAEEGVDERLLKLAKQHGATICTIDYNLNKVAQVEGIKVLNVNELARTLRMAYLPGETVMLALTTKGNDSSQAVGHLEDGTMVVVEQAKGKIGSVVEVEIIRSLQTAAGRMMFARLTKKAEKGDGNGAKTAVAAAKPQATGRRQASRASQPKKEKESPAQREPRSDSRAKVAKTVKTEPTSPSDAPKPQEASRPRGGRGTRRPATPQSDAASAPPAEAPRPSQPRRRAPRRSRDNESRLIALVNNQEQE